MHLTEEGKAMEARAAHIPAAILARTGHTQETLSDMRTALDQLSDQLRAGEANGAS